VAGIDQRFIDKKEDLLCDGVNYLLESGRGPCLAWASREEGVSGKKVLPREQAQAARCMARGVKNPQVCCAEVHHIAILQW